MRARAAVAAIHRNRADRASSQTSPGLRGAPRVVELSKVCQRLWVSGVALPRVRGGGSLLSLLTGEGGGQEEVTSLKYEEVKKEPVGTLLLGRVWHFRFFTYVAFWAVTDVGGTLIWTLHWINVPKHRKPLQNAYGEGLGQRERPWYLETLRFTSGADPLESAPLSWIKDNITADWSIWGRVKRPGWHIAAGPCVTFQRFNRHFQTNSLKLCN